MKYYEIELNGETLKFRLTSNDCMAIEKMSGKPFGDYISEMSMTTVITLLKYMRRSSVLNFSENEASELFDKLIDNGYDLEGIISDIIMETLVVSGFMKKADLEAIKDVKEELKDKVVKK